MSTEKPETTDRIVAFRCPPVLALAMKTAAKKQFTSVSDLVRASLAREMRANGLLDENA